MNEKIEIKVGDKIFQLSELPVIKLEEVLVELYKNYNFDKDKAVKKTIELSLINKDVTVTEEDYYYLSENLDVILDGCILDCDEDEDDGIISYTIKEKDVEYKCFLKVPSWKEVKELREYQKNQIYLSLDIDLYNFCKSLIPKLLIDSVKDENGNVIPSNPKFISDNKLQIPIAIRLLSKIKAKNVEVKKKY